MNISVSIWASVYFYRNTLPHFNFPIHKGVKTTFSAYPYDDKNKTGFLDTILKHTLLEIHIYVMP